MDALSDFISNIPKIEHQKKLTEVFHWVQNTFPTLQSKIAWNQPMFTNNGTFIIGFSVSKNHFAFAVEEKCMNAFETDIQNSGLSFTKNLVRVQWNQAVPYELLKKLIAFNIADKQGYTKFWR